MFYSDWLPQREALQVLGMSRSTLHRLRAAGLLRDGVHAYRIGMGQRAPLRFNVPAIQLALRVQSAATRAGSAPN